MCVNNSGSCSSSSVTGLLVVLFLVVSTGVSSPSSTKGRTQLVTVSAPWPTSCLSPLAEASEFVAEGSSGDRDLFWDYIEAAGNAPHWVFSCGAGESHDGKGDEGNEEEEEEEAERGVDLTMEGVVTIAVRAAGQGFGGGDGVGLDELPLRLMEVALSARAHAPVIESHRALAGTTVSVCNTDTQSGSPSAWAVLFPGGSVVCSPRELSDALSRKCSAQAASDGAADAREGVTGRWDQEEDGGGGGGGGGACLSPPPLSAGVCEEGGSGVPVGEAFEFDHVYRRNAGEGGGSSSSCSVATAILYGVVGSPAVMGFHVVLKAAAETGSVRYVFRHALPYGGGRGGGGGGGCGGGGGGGDTTPLQGYGVVLDVKNMEYQNYDSSTSTEEDGDRDGGAEGKGADALSIVEGEEVSGVVISTILARRPELKRELGILRQALLLEQETGGGDGGGGGDAGSEELKVWNMADLGLQALQSVAGAEKPLVRLEELSQNFPSHASVLSALKVQRSTREEVQITQFSFFQELGLRHGTLYVNGKMLDLEGQTFNAFQILSTLRAEAAQLGELASIGAPRGSLVGDRGRSLLTTSGAIVNPASSGVRGGRGGGKDWRIDVLGPTKVAAVATSKGSSAPSAVVWLNDIEKDDNYKAWSPSVAQLTYRGFQLPRVRKNLCNVVVVADPTTAAGVEAMQILSMVVEQRMPVRVGLVLASERDVEAIADAVDGGGFGAGGDVDPLAVPQVREMAELLSRISQHAGRSAAAKLVKDMTAALAAADPRSASDGGVGGEAGNGVVLSRQKLSSIFVKAAGKKRILTDSPAAAEPWTEEGASWKGGEGGEDDDAEPLAGARAMARLCSSKGLKVQSWSLNGSIKGGLGEMRTTLMQAVMQENMVIGQLVLGGLVSDTTKNVYSRVLKHCGAKIYPRVHPALTESVGDARVINLSSARAVELFEGSRRAGTGGREGSPELPPLDWLHPSATSDSAKGVSLVAVVDPFSRDGLQTLEQALSLLLSGDAAVDDAAAIDDGDDALPKAGLRLAVVFNPSEGHASQEREARGGNGERSAVIGRVIPALFEILEGRSPDKVPKFLLSVAREAIASATTTGAATSVASIGALAKEAGLSASLRTTVANAASAALRDGDAPETLEVHGGGGGGGGGRGGVGGEEEALSVGARRAGLVRRVVGLDAGESCALVNGRRAPTGEGRAMTVSDLSIVTEAADDLGEFVLKWALAWDWGSWPEGSPESLDPDLVNARLQSNVVSTLASYLLRYHQEPRKAMPDPDELSDALSEVISHKSKSGLRSVLSLDSDGRIRRRKSRSDATDGDATDGDATDGDATDGDATDGDRPEEDNTEVPSSEEDDASTREEDELGVVELVAVLDPLSMAAQRASSFLVMAQEVLGLRVTLLLTPSADVSELPLKNFYRLVLGPNSRSRASFERLPTRDILTQRLDTPEPWNVQASAALQDLDNLRCDPGGCGDNGTYTTSAEYSLKSLLITGRCYDVTAGNPSPPQGLQVVLKRPCHGAAPEGAGRDGARASDSSAVLSDTVVMDNLGYFQLQAKPGVWELALAAGRASEVYEIVGSADDGGGGGSNGGASGAAHRAAFEVNRRLRRVSEEREGSFAVESQAIVVRNFYSRYEPFLVRKKPSMESVGLLEEPEAAQVSPPAPAGSVDAPPLVESVWSSVKGVVGLSRGAGEGKGEEEGAASKELVGADVGGVIAGGGGGSRAEGERVHVFSLATGHLYERFLKVMMLSVVKRCSMPVTFWLLENFLSSSLKESAQVMAEEFGFRVEFVTYKWPEWLRRQSEKQRIIWGYKILFLDVLFPLHVDKIIYVDADQVVRADLKELWDLDLQGAPYAYTPFCSSREETLGYQFWRGGFWQSHLMGRPYHISALYVVNLKTFRRMAVGDSLRSMYNQLSADPNSLSNLDQDLPNYAQYQVPIFSLPQEWLWCETWCSDTSKAQAKTIDLCNNPQHKEPKLDMAKRVISGPLFEESWVELDAEVRAGEARRGQPALA